jgi:paraquat-inducible protein B
VENIIGRLEKIPTDRIGRDLKTVLGNMDVNLRQTRALFGEINENVLPEITRAMIKFQTSLAEIEKSYGKDSVTNQELRNALGEMGEAARSIRFLTEYLQRRPESLIRGKGEAE